MSGKSLNARISAYKEASASREIQKTYQDLVGIVQNLRTDFSKIYIGEYSVANVLHGYIDFLVPMLCVGTTQDDKHDSHGGPWEPGIYL